MPLFDSWLLFALHSYLVRNAFMPYIFQIIFK